MRPQYTLLTPPATEPVSLQQASDHLRVDSDSDAALIEALIPVGREMADGLTGRVSGRCTWRLIAPSWASLCGGTDLVPNYPRAREVGELLNCATIYRTPLVSVQSVKYIAAGDTAQTTMDAADYAVITASEPGIIQFLSALPSLADRPDAIQIDFTAGYETAALAPPGLKHLIKLIVGHYYETRTPVAFASATEIPFTIRAIVENQKVRGWMA